MPLRAARFASARALALALMLAAGAACSRSSAPPSPGAPTPPGAQSKGAAEVSAGAKEVAAGAKQMAHGLEQMAQAAAKPVDFQELEALLPEVNGWKKTAAAGEMLSLPVPYALAHARYARDAATVDLEIEDTALSQVLLGPAAMFMSTGFEEKSDDGYTKALTLAGAPGYEDWNKTESTSELTLIIANRFIVRGKGKDVASVDPVRTVVQAVNLQKLAKLK